MAATLSKGALTLDRYGYKWKGERYQRVTTLKGMLGTGNALIDWAAREVAAKAASYADDLLAGKLDAQTLAVMLKSPELAQAHNLTRDNAANFGTTFHELVERLANNDQSALDHVDLSDERMRSDAEAFWDWNEQVNPIWIESEVSVFNRTYHYAGTVDAVCDIGGERLLVDVKTSKAVYGEYALQLAAYRYSEFIGRPDGREEPMSKVDGCGILHVRDGKCRLLRVEAGLAQFQAFLACHQLYWWKRDQPEPVEWAPALDMEAFA